MYRNITFPGAICPIPICLHWALKDNTVFSWLEFWMLDRSEYSEYHHCIVLMSVSHLNVLSGGFLCVCLWCVCSHSFLMCDWKPPWNALCLISIYFHSSSVYSFSALAYALTSFDTGSTRYCNKDTDESSRNQYKKKKKKKKKSC